MPFAVDTKQNPNILGGVIIDCAAGAFIITLVFKDKGVFDDVDFLITKKYIGNIIINIKINIIPILTNNRFLL